MRNKRREGNRVATIKKKLKEEKESKKWKGEDRVFVPNRGMVSRTM